MTPEGKVLKETFAELAKIPGVIPLRLNAGLIVWKGRVFHGAPKGTPDILVMLPHERCIWLEAKSEKGQLTEEQVKWHDRARRIDHTVVVIRSAEEAVQAVMEALDA